MTKVRLLRTTIGAIANAEAVDQPAANRTEVPRRHLNADAVGAILQREIDEREVAADEYDAYGVGLEAERLRGEVMVLQHYLALLRPV